MKYVLFRHYELKNPDDVKDGYDPLPDEEIDCFDTREEAEKLQKSFNDFFDDEIKFYNHYTFTHIIKEIEP